MSSNVGLQGLLMRESVECGVYIGYGSRNIVSMVLDVVARIARPAVDPFAPAAPQIIWIDAGNSFDPYRLSVSARRLGRDPRSILKSIKVARPFTAFQLHEIIAKVPRTAVPPRPINLAEGRGSPKIGAVPSFLRHKLVGTPLVVISDLMGLFYDGDLPERDMERAFRQFQLRLAELGQRAVVIGLVVNQPVPAQRKHLLPPVLGLARRVFAPSCTAGEDLVAPAKRLALAACSLLLIGGWTLMKRIMHG